MRGRKATCRNADKILPVHQRPKCKQCRKALKPHVDYIFPTPITSEAIFNNTYGKFGNNHFCNYGCGFAWARSIAESLTSGAYRLVRQAQ